MAPRGQWQRGQWQRFVPASRSPPPSRGRGVGEGALKAPVGAWLCPAEGWFVVVCVCVCGGERGVCGRLVPRGEREACCGHRCSGPSSKKAAVEVEGGWFWWRTRCVHRLFIFFKQGALVQMVCTAGGGTEPVAAKPRLRVCLGRR